MNRYDLCVIGAGRLGEIVVERAAVPKKLLIALPDSPETYLERLLAFLSGATIATPVQTEGTIERLGGSAQFLSPHQIQVAGQTIEARQFVLILGSGPLPPPQRGAAPALFPLDADSLPASAPVTVFGAGPVACALAQRLACRKNLVTLAAAQPLLAQEDQDARAFITKIFTAAGIKFVEQDSAGTPLFASGLQPNTAGFNLEKAGVLVRPDGVIAVNDEMRTSAPHIYAVGAAAGAHDAAFEQIQAETAATNLTAPFFARAKILPTAVAHVVFTSPQIARAGLTEQQAKQTHKRARAESTPLSDGKGFIKIIGDDKGGEIFGAHIVAERAAEMILYFDLAMRAGISLLDLNEELYFPAFTGGEEIGRAVRKWVKKA